MYTLAGYMGFVPWSILRLTPIASLYMGYVVQILLYIVLSLYIYLYIHAHSASVTGLLITISYSACFL